MPTRSPIGTAIVGPSLLKLLQQFYAFFDAWPWMAQERDADFVCVAVLVCEPVGKDLRVSLPTVICESERNF